MVAKFGGLYGPSQRDNVETGQQLLEQILSENSRLLISEDISQLKSAFQSELQFLIDTETVDNRFTSLPQILCFLVAILIGITSLFVDYLFILAFSFGIVVLIFLFILYKRYSKKQFCDTFQAIVNELKNEKELYKKLIQLIEDYTAFSDNESHESRVEALKVAFRDTALKSFLHLRQCTNLLLDRFPLKADIDDNLICRLPDDSFESYNNNEELTLKALKSLKQLIRLQISELLKRFLFLFIQNYFSNSIDFDVDFFSYLQANVFKQILSESRDRQKALLSVLYYHKSLYQADLAPPERLPIDSNHPMANLWPICRNIRKSLYASLVIVDDFEVILQANGELSLEEKAVIERKLDALNSEIETMQYSTQNIFKLIKMQGLKEHCKTENEALNTDRTDGEVVENTNKAAVEEYVAQDEVFEAYIPQWKKEEKPDNSMDCADEDENFAEAVASNNVFHELKHALKNKAIEHKLREAKALGIEVDVKQLEEEYITAVIEKLNNEERKRVFVGPSTKEVDTTVGHSDNSDNSPNYKFAFNLDIAMKATEKMRLMLTTDVNEDTFECDTPAEFHGSDSDS